MPTSPVIKIGKQEYHDPTTISALITGIKERLVLFTKELGAKVEDWPEDPIEYWKSFQHPKGAYLVHFRGSDFSDSRTLDFIHQEETIEMLIAVCRRHVRQKNYQLNAINMLEIAKFALTGFQVPGFSRLYPTKRITLEPTSGEGLYGVLFYGILFQTKTPAVQLIDPLLKVKLKKLIFDASFETGTPFEQFIVPSTETGISEGVKPPPPVPPPPPQP
jgi:hypothetical protein